MASNSRWPSAFLNRDKPLPDVPAPQHRTRQHPPFTNGGVFVPTEKQQIQSDSSSDDDVPIPTRPSQRPRPQHSRAMSHPFPSLFASKKQKKPFKDESTDDDGLKVGQTNLRPSMISRNDSRGAAEFASGTCMTCSGKVRWPKELNVFRCTKCMTVNDLSPHMPKTDKGDGSECPEPLSLDRTRTLIRQCLRQALETSVSPDGRFVPTETWPSRSSSHVLSARPEMMNSPARHGKSPSLGIVPSPGRNDPVFDDFSDACLDPDPLTKTMPASRSNSTSYPDARSSAYVAPRSGSRWNKDLDPKRIFKPVEDYLVTCFGSFECINTSFVLRRQSFNSKPQVPIKRKPVPSSRHAQPALQEKPQNQEEALVTEMDAKLLLVGDLAENAQFWAGGHGENMPRSRSQRQDEILNACSRSPRINWAELADWYRAIIEAARPWRRIYEDALERDPTRCLSAQQQQDFDTIVIEAQTHLQRVLMKCIEMLLKRPGRLLQKPQDVRFFLLIIANPLLDPGHRSYAGELQPWSKGKSSTTNPTTVSSEGSSMGRHSGIIKRITGLISNSSDQCHRQLVTWLAKIPEHLFLRTKEMISTFVNYRLKRQSEKKFEPEVDLTAGLIPELSNNRSGNTPASLHAALTGATGSKKQKDSSEAPRLVYGDDWQLKAGAKVMALVFAANNLTHVRQNEVSLRHAHGHLLATSDFYNSMLDCLDFKADFELWESRKGKFSFCQYPFFLSIWAKIQILEFDAKRQMHGKAREAFFDSILSRKIYNQYLFLSVRRDCLVEDSLAKVSEVVGSGSDDIKKGLRIEFQGEEGVDAGGLRKEWFQLLVKEVFNPDHGLFIFDEDSQYCYFNPHTFETTDQYFLVGVVLGLAIYNSTILDVAFPPFAFRKLLAAAPASPATTSVQQRSTTPHTLDDLAEYRPRLAAGLRQLLDFDGDVETTFCLDFVIEVDKYGSRSRVPLCWRGEEKPVTNSNRREYVDLYVRYLLDESVKRQFEPFKRGFFTICAGNALSLFRPEEIELLVRGSDEPLDITSLRAVAKYTEWNKSKSELEPENEPTIGWFWDSFAAVSPADQRRLLSFITGSDRIPAMGAASLVIKISCLGEDFGRYPTARTCFNVLNLYRYHTRERLDYFLWTAVNESEGFGLR